MNVIPMPLSTMRMKVSMLPRPYANWLLCDAFIWQKRTIWSRKQCPSSSNHSCPLLATSAVRMDSLAYKGSSRETYPMYLS